MDAWSIFVHARSAVSSAQYPWRLDYTIAVSGLDGQTPVSDHYSAVCNPAEDAIKVMPISDEQLKKPPPVPHGVNTNFDIAICFGLCFGIRLPMGHPAPYQDLIGLPLVTPTYMFGLRYNGVPYNVKPVGTESSLPVIATVSAKNRDYAVSLAGEEPVDGVDTYHLQLTPLRKPKDNRLRELWVGTSDYLPRRAIVAGNFTMAPLVSVPWTIDFAVVNGTPYATREAAGDVLYLAHHRVVRNATIAFENIGEAAPTIYGEPLVTPEQSENSEPELVEPN